MPPPLGARSGGAARPGPAPRGANCVPAPQSRLSPTSPLLPSELARTRRAGAGKWRPRRAAPPRPQGLGSVQSRLWQLRPPPDRSHVAAGRLALPQARTPHTHSRAGALPGRAPSLPTSPSARGRLPPGPAPAARPRGQAPPLRPLAPPRRGVAL
ncbi:basic proline-rich protein-like, partial [Nannospalax galili]|uniref:basic proline-rich protein-like n=1 Tax=Nannospalax galili TaxID=1026970 RepID=UPI00111C5B71